MRNPIGTTNILLGFDIGLAKDFFRIATAPAPGSPSRAFTSEEFTQKINANDDLVLLSTQNSELIRFEHSFNIDGENKAPHFKIKFLDMDETVFNKLLKHYVHIDPEAWSAPGTGPMYRTITPPTARDIENAVRELGGTYLGESPGAGAGFVPNAVDFSFGTGRAALDEYEAASEDVKQLFLSNYLGNLYGLAPGSEYDAFVEQMRRVSLLAKKVKGNVLLTKVFVMYGMGADFKYWAGPFQGFITKIALNYDANLGKEFEIIINAATVPEEEANESEFAVTQSFAVQEITRLQQEDGIVNAYKNTQNSPLTVIVSRLISEWLKKRYNKKNVIVVLPDLDFFLLPLLQVILTSYTTQQVKWNEGGSSFWAGVHAHLGSFLGLDPDEEDVEIFVEAFRVEEDASDPEGLLKTSWALNNAYRIILGFLGFNAGESPAYVDDNRLLSDPLERSSPFEANARDKVRALTIEDVANSMEGVLGANATNMWSKTVAGLGAKQYAYATGKNMQLSITIDNSKVDSAQSLLRGLFRRMDSAMLDYSMGGEPFFVFENNAEIINGWLSTPADAGFGVGTSVRVGGPFFGGYESGSTGTPIEDNAFNLDLNEGSVLVVGDAKLIRNYLYGDMYYAELAASVDPDMDPISEDAIRKPLPTGIDAAQRNEPAAAIATYDPFIGTGRTSPGPLHSWKAYDITNMNAALTSKEFWEKMAVIGRSTKTTSYFEPSPILVDFAGDGDLREAFEKLREVFPEFRAGVPESNILSLEENLDKYLLANIYKISHSSVIKDFMRAGGTR